MILSSIILKKFNATSLSENTGEASAADGLLVEPFKYGPEKLL